MKVLVFSDSHRSLGGMYEAIETHKPDQVFHLGDLLSDAEEVSYLYPHLPICTVPGNCDGWTSDPLKKQITLDGVRILLSHGHVWHVKTGYSTAIAEARSIQADVLLFGHTHHPYCEQLEDGLWVLNPGASRSSYGILDIHRGQVHCQLVYFD